VISGFFLRDSFHYYAARTASLGEGRDQIRGFDAAYVQAHATVELARKYLERAMPAESTLLVVPEGVMLNYWTRRRHPLRIGEMLPPTLRLNRQPVLPDLQRSPPDYIVFLSRIADEYRPFGSDSDTGRDILRWINERYSVVAQAGVDPLLPFNGREFGFRILRKSSVPSGLSSKL
jgi:hypothetical protein